MSSTAPRRPGFSGLAAGTALALSTATLIAGCAAQVRVEGPPPPRVYVAPPVVTAEVGAPGVAVTLTATEAPPPLPEYEQPPCPEDGYIWTPGYWHYGPAGYYWVPGTWVQPPSVGVLWTPGYWGFAGGVYGFHAGYWGPHVGFYGGVNYGFGYVGVGFAGGHWDGGRFAYNTVVNNVTVNRTSFNGGPGGVQAVPTPQERAAAQERHVPPTPMQVSHVQEAAKNPALSARTNGGHPAIAATARPGNFSGPGVVGARGAAPMAAKSVAPNAERPNNAPGANHGPNGGMSPANREPERQPKAPANAANQAPKAGGNVQAANGRPANANPQARVASNKAPVQKAQQKKAPPKQPPKPKPNGNAGEEKRHES
jgi:hypothetical protein